MKRIGLLFLLACAAVPARAGAYNTTCTRVLISTSIPTELTGNISTNTATVAPASVWAIKVTNLDTSADLFSNQDVSVSSFSTHMGEQIAHSSAAPWNWLAWIINSSKDWYAISNGAAATAAEVCLTQ